MDSDSGFIRALVVHEQRGISEALAQVSSFSTGVALRSPGECDEMLLPASLPPRGSDVAGLGEAQAD